ncbi:MAG: FAD:protein FMN transferase [Eubacterium sp.]|nr:FAD:protein FMN transferase [Eubacterium sp.]
MEKRIMVPLLVGFILLLGAIAWLLFRDGSIDNSLSVSEETEDGELKEELFAMDTVMEITLYRTGMTDKPLRDVFLEMRDRIYQLEGELSVTNSESEISRLNASSGTGEWMTVSDDVGYLVKETGYLAKYTEMDAANHKYAFDPTLLPVVRLWGFTTGEFRVPSEAEIQKALEKTGIDKVESADEEKPKVRLNDGVQLDFGACAKGYLSDELSRIMKAHHVNGIMSLGGNVQTVGTKPDGSPFVVGITDPADGSSMFATLESTDEAVITSGDYQRYFEDGGKRYHHIMDSRTGAPADNDLASVTVIGKQGFTCDIYATAFFVMGEELTKQYIENKSFADKVILIRKDGSYWVSDGVNLIK